MSISGEKITEAGAIVLKLSGHRDGKTESFTVPPDNTTTEVKIALTPLPHVTFASTPAGASVRVEGTEAKLGTTPFDWVMSEALADKLAAGESVRLTFERPGSRASTHTLTQDQLKNGRAVVAKPLKPVVRRALGPAHSGRSKSATKRAESKPKPKPKPKKKPKKKPRSGFTF